MIDVIGAPEATGVGDTALADDLVADLVDDSVEDWSGMVQGFPEIEPDASMGMLLPTIPEIEEDDLSVASDVNEDLEKPIARTHLFSDSFFAGTCELLDFALEGAASKMFGCLDVADSENNLMCDNDGTGFQALLLPDTSCLAPCVRRSFKRCLRPRELTPGEDVFPLAAALQPSIFAPPLSSPESDDFGVQQAPTLPANNQMIPMPPKTSRSSACPRRFSTTVNSTAKKESSTSCFFDIVCGLMDGALSGRAGELFGQIDMEVQSAISPKMYQGARCEEAVVSKPSAARSERPGSARHLRPESGSRVATPAEPCAPCLPADFRSLAAPRRRFQRLIPAHAPDVKLPLSGKLLLQTTRKTSAAFHVGSQTPAIAAYMKPEQTASPEKSFKATAQTAAVSAMELDLGQAASSEQVSSNCWNQPATVDYSIDLGAESTAGPKTMNFLPAIASASQTKEAGAWRMGIVRSELQRDRRLAYNIF